MLKDFNKESIVTVHSLEALDAIIKAQWHSVFCVYLPDYLYLCNQEGWNMGNTNNRTFSYNRGIRYKGNTYPSQCIYDPATWAEFNWK